MGGDTVPGENIKGAFQAINAYDNVHVILVGPEELLLKRIPKYGKWPNDRLSIQHAPEVVGMAESPSMSFRKKKESSIQIGLNLVKQGKAHGFVSAGNTGAVMAASTFILGRASGVERPALAAILPSKSRPFIMLDMGANVDCKPSHLEQYAIMGHYFSKLVLNVKKPRIGLLNIGEEKDKGDSLSLATYPLLEELPINFIGNVESKAITQDAADVVVCDGFVGNTMLKFGEGIVKLMTNFFKAEAKRSLLSLFALALLKPGLKRFKKKLDYNEYGGAQLLGLNGISVIAHGSSKRKAIKNAIRTALLGIETEVVKTIETAIAKKKPTPVKEEIT